MTNFADINLLNDHSSLPIEKVELQARPGTRGVLNGLRNRLIIKNDFTPLDS